MIGARAHDTSVRTCHSQHCYRTVKSRSPNSRWARHVISAAAARHLEPGVADVEDAAVWGPQLAAVAPVLTDVLRHLLLVLLLRETNV